MKRIVLVVLVAAELFVLLCACGGAQEAPAPPAAEPPASSAEKMPSAAICMGSIRHPIHRLVQLGFMEAADELGYEGHILGLAESSIQELLDCWLQGAREYDIAGAVCWVGDESAYEFLKELHGMGVKTVVPHFPHNYYETKDFIDVNAYADLDQALYDAGEYLVERLRERGIRSGALGVSVSGPALLHEDVMEYMSYMESKYPEYRMADMLLEHSETETSIERMVEYIEANPDLVGVVGRTGASAITWSRAKSRAGREDIFAMGMDYSENNLDVLTSGGIDALVCLPLYEAGSVGLELIDSLLQGAVYQEEEEQWHCELDIRIVTKDGQGQNGAAYYNAMYARSAARFGS